ncbi:hypothetical protein AB0I30_19885 [Nocardia tengchongensis]|uniref:hypothetical protein n=1 Tax=Nocardia tengchongensis TaxID=2055889 RepID=UPI0033FCA615
MTDFLTKLVRPAVHAQHLLTLGNGWSTTIEQLRDGTHSVEHPSVIAELLRILEHREQTALILRTFTPEISHVLPNGTPIPVKEVRGWVISDGLAHPLTERQVFDASCVDADTGEPIPPEQAVRYVDAYPLPVED